jgi:hypothetical protein
MKGEGLMDHHSDMDQGHSMSADMQNCIEECLNCHSVCLRTISHCLQMGGEHASPAHIRLLMDCAEICQTSANFMLRASDLHGLTCGVCAEVCERCADDCARFDNDSAMQQCAEACRRCARSCREMASMSGQPTRAAVGRGGG